MIRNLVGPPVLGIDFIGRKKELNAAWNALAATNSLLLSSPRRVGKSSFARKLIEKAKEKEWSAIYLDVQGIKNETEFGGYLLTELQKIKNEASHTESIKNKIGKLFHSVKKVEFIDFGVEFDKSPQLFYAKLDETFPLPKRTLIVIDELAIYLQQLVKDGDISRAETFMNWLRNVRQKEVQNISWIFCSSVSINNFLSQHGISYTINDISSFHLGEMNEADALLLLEQLNHSNRQIMDDHQIRYVLARIQWKLPFFIQLFFKTYSINSDEYKKISIEEATDLIFKDMANEHQLYTWSERLSGYGKDEKIARLLLNYFCLPKHKSDRKHLESLIATIALPDDDIAERYSTVKQMLESDGYIVQEEGKIYFRSPIIREFWFNKYIR